MSKIDAAKQLVADGFRVFPLSINGKTPALDGNWQVIATTDPQRIDALWRCPVFGDPLDYNIGIALGPTDVVIDVDVRDGKRGAESLRLWEAINDPLPDTYEVTTASGGRHLYYKDERSGTFPKELAAHVDIKQHGGYVVGPGSEIDGNRYAVQHQRPAAPHSFATLATTKPRDVRKPAATGTPLVECDLPGAIARATAWLTDAAPEAIEGAGGDLTTLTVANRVGDFGISESLCVELMLDHWNDTKAAPPWDADALADKVANAYRYRQNAVGIASAEAEFEAVEIDQKPTVKRRKGLFFQDYNEVVLDADRPYLVEDVIDAGSMVVTYGDSNTGKSYVALDMAYHVAIGAEWIGRKTRAGLVVYVAAEGREGFQRRIVAFRTYYKTRDVPFALVPCPIDLQSDNADTGRLIRLIQDAEIRFGQKCVLIVVDTLARAMAGGDENTATDMGRFVGHCNRLQHATGAAVHIIHHTGKDKSKGARGSSALRAATDTEIAIAPGLMAIEKQRDMAFAPPRHFRLLPVEIGRRQDGKPVTACVVEWPAESEFEQRTSTEAREFFELLEGLVAEKQDGGDGDKDDNAVDWGEWELSGLETMKGARGGRIARSVLFRLRKELTQSGLVKPHKKNQWLIA